ncbi:hypothetical protein DACRYDRAFT_24386 [Dacryopinax primogenitus]|uniref:Uncharacterized protein n=1 Tax=Dacryopinax primogenitus (strain DJM 731) TaxID=1858805 RepID=M5FP83_DACPD|nr:uncharacterized protein DACRYDRAFT_24386 [Dacryopinax primogenitus]EJT98315.1 hypothetical protein DACRYDRAFT_24386 [Dacryopinax primogenitus]
MGPSITPATPVGPRSRLPLAAAEPPKEPRSVRAQHKGLKEIEELLGMPVPSWVLGEKERRIWNGIVPYVKEKDAANTWSGFATAGAYDEHQKVLSNIDDLSSSHTGLLHTLRSATFALKDEEREFNAATTRRDIAEGMAERVGRGMTLAEGHESLGIN